MATQLQMRRGTQSEHTSFTGAEGEVSVNTTNESLHVHNGSAAGGFELARADLDNVSDSDLNAALTGNTIGSLTITTAGITSLSLGGVSVTSTAAELNILDGVTSTAAELNILDGVTSTTAELNILDGVTATTAELNFVDGVTSAIQTQIDTKAPLASPTFTGTVTADGLTVDGDGTIQSNASSSVPTLTLKDTDTSISVGQSLGRLSFSSADSSPDSAGERAFVRGYLIDGSNYGVDIGAMASGGSPASVLTVSGSGSVGIGTSSPDKTLHVVGSDGVTAFSGYGSRDFLVLENNQNCNFQIISNSSNAGNILFSDEGASGRGILKYDHASDFMSFTTAATEKARLDNSGNLLVGTTNTAPYATSTTGGMVFRADFNLLGVSRQNNYALSVNRFGNDGDLVNFRKDGTTVGSIGVFNGVPYIGYTGGAGGGIMFNGKSIQPTGLTTSRTDGENDIGSNSFRWKDLYRSGSTYSTSDRNMKQDIRDLTDAERNVAVAAKGLLKAFRFIDTVAAEGDSANIHFGIIAQDLAAAFTAEGLDANDYQVYKSATTTDDEGNEQTRLNVCYENLLAFIISAI